MNESESNSTFRTKWMKVRVILRSGHQRMHRGPALRHRVAGLHQHDRLVPLHLPTGLPVQQSDVRRYKWVLEFAKVVLTGDVSQHGGLVPLRLSGGLRVLQRTVCGYQWMSQSAVREKCRLHEYDWQLWVPLSAGHDGGRRFRRWGCLFAR